MESLNIIFIFIYIVLGLVSMTPVSFCRVVRTATNDDPTAVLDLLNDIVGGSDVSYCVQQRMSSNFTLSKEW